MRERSRRLWTFCLTVTSALFAGGGSPAAAQESYTELFEQGMGVLERAAVEAAEPTQIETDSLSFFDDPQRFLASCPDLPLEDFEDTSAPPSAVVTCSSFLNSSTNNACYRSGALLDGFTLRSLFDSLVVLTPFAFGVTSVVAGPSSFADDSEIIFSNGGVTGVGMDLLTGVPLPNGTIDIEIFGSADVSLGAITAPLPGPPGQFFGVISVEPIERIAFSGGEGELFDNLEFGQCGLRVDIDIMPSDDGNNLNLRAGKGATIGVAVLSVGEFFDAPNAIDPSTLRFGPAKASISGSPQIRDVDGDGDGDLVVKFPTLQSGIACGDTHASLSGYTLGSESISGTDVINTFNCPRIRKRH